jgi:long-chain fatty acid transport protein
MFAVALAVRYINSEKWLNATAPATLAGGQATAEYEATATGWGGIIGLDIFLNKEVTIGLKYETKTRLEYEYTHQGGTNAAGRNVLNQFWYTNGGKAHEDLPAMFSAGVSYRVTPAIRIEPTFTYYFQKDADLGGIGKTSKTLEDRISDGYEIGVALEYAFTETLKASLGFLWTDTGVDANDMLPEAPELDARSICAGFAWKAKPNLELNVGIGKVNYLNERVSSTATYFSNEEYSKDVIYMGFGIQYKFF